MTSKTVSYFSEGHVIVGTLFTPDNMIEEFKYPAIGICTGFTGIRAGELSDAMGQALNDAGYIGLSFDYRGFGDSGGERGRLAPLEQVDDIRNTITYLQHLDFVDPDNIGLVGVSYGCLTVPHAAAVDKRVKAALGCVGVATGYSAVTNTRSPEEMAEWERKVEESRRRRVLFNQIDRDVRAIDVFLDEQSIANLPLVWESVEMWRNPIGFDSIGRVMEHRPIDYVHQIAPRALGLICAQNDKCADPDSLRQMFAAAQEPKRWIEVPDVGHFDLYSGELQKVFMSKIVGFFQEFIEAKQPEAV